ncbi:hypothetical protein pb186bvf_000276 [Paramecium bursaria]
MKIDNCKRSEVREKLMETLLISSKFTHLNPQQIEYEEATKSKKIQTCIWNKHTVQEGDLVILNSIDNMATIKFNTRNFQIFIQWFQLLKPVIGQENNQLITQFINKYKLDNKPNTTLNYQYIRVSKLISVFNIPEEFLAPCLLILKDYLHNPILQQLNLVFNTELMEYLFEGDKNGKEDQYFLEQYKAYFVQDQLLSKLPVDKDQKLLLNDSIPPTTNKLNQMHLDKIILMIQGETILWFSDNYGLGSYRDEILLRDYNMWQIGEYRWEQSIYDDEFELTDFDVQCKHNQHKQQQSKPLEKSYYNIIPGDFSICKSIDLLQVGNFVTLKNGSVKCKFIDRTIITLKYPPPFEIKIINNLGQIIVIDFNPEITNQYYQDYNFFITYIPFEWQDYMKQAFKIAEESFILKEIQQSRDKHQELLSSWVSNELDKTNRFLVITGKQQIQNEQQENQFSESNIQEQINKILQANEQLLKQSFK